MTRKQFALSLTCLIVAGFLGGLFSGGVAPVIARSISEDTITVKKIIIVDKNEVPVIEIGCNSNNEPSISLRDLDKGRQASINLDTKHGPALTLINDWGNNLVILSNAFTMRDGNKQPRISMGVTKEGGASLGLSDRAGEITWGQFSE